MAKRRVKAAPARKAKAKAKAKAEPKPPALEKKLWRGGLRKQVKDGKPGAICEYCERLVDMLFRGEISRDMAETLRKFANTFQDVDAIAEGKRMRATIDKTRELLDSKRKPGQHLRAAGQPPDALAPSPPGASSAGEPAEPSSPT